jgi:hypothetical protein
MTKQVNHKNQIWFEQQDNVVKVGFTKSFLEKLEQCWHILPANMGRFREHSPLMVIETNDALISVKSPVSANFSQWSDKAQNFPDQLTEEDVVLEMYTGPAQRREQRPQAVVDEFQPQHGWDEVAPAAPRGVLFGAAPQMPQMVQAGRDPLAERVREQNEAIRRQPQFGAAVRPRNR